MEQATGMCPVARLGGRSVALVGAAIPAAAGCRPATSLAGRSPTDVPGCRQSTRGRVHARRSAAVGAATSRRRSDGASTGRPTRRSDRFSAMAATHRSPRSARRRHPAASPADPPATTAAARLHVGRVADPVPTGFVESIVPIEVDGGLDDGRETGVGPFDDSRENDRTAIRTHGPVDRPPRPGC